MMTAEEALEASKGLTFEKVWAMFQETRNEIREQSEETSKRLEETRRQIEETGKQIKELSKETDKQIKELSRETDKQIKELSRETDKQIKELSKNIGGLSSSLGKWAEEMVAANLWEKFKSMGYTFEHGGPEKYWENNRLVAQVDILLENGDYAMAVEVKSVLAERDVDEHLERIQKVRRQLDKRKDRRKLVGAVAGMAVAEEVRDYAQRKGLYVLVQSGDSVTVADAPNSFTARVW
jgi:hypothetical protein